MTPTPSTATPGTPQLAGLYVPLITPFDAAGGVATDALGALARRILDAGAAGLVALGTTGEPSSLTDAERHTATEVIAQACLERSAQLIVGANTPQALRGLRAYPNVTAALSAVPAFVRPGEAGVLAHFAQLAAASPVPLVVYDIPCRTGQYLSADALRRLASIPAVCGVKYAPGGINADTVALLADAPEGLSLLGGDDPFVSPLLALGAHGGVLASAHLATEQFAALIDAWRNGRAAEARTIGHRLSPLSTALFAEPNPSVIKAVLHALGQIPTAAVRLPLLEAGAASTAAALRRLSTATGASERPHSPDHPLRVDVTMP